MDHVTKVSVTAGFRSEPRTVLLSFGPNFGRRSRVRYCMVLVQIRRFRITAERGGLHVQRTHLQICGTVAEFLYRSDSVLPKNHRIVRTGSIVGPQTNSGPF